MILVELIVCAGGGGAPINSPSGVLSTLEQFVVMQREHPRQATEIHEKE